MQQQHVLLQNASPKTIHHPLNNKTILMMRLIVSLEVPSSTCMIVTWRRKNNNTYHYNTRQGIQRTQQPQHPLFLKGSQRHQRNSKQEIESQEEEGNDTILHHMMMKKTTMMKEKNLKRMGRTPLIV